MKKILVIYYSQTGQLMNLLDSFLEPFSKENVSIVFEKIKPVHDFPFPWTSKEFMEAFPETYLEDPVELNPLSSDSYQNFDLIILAWQPWFLSPSLPVSSFLNTSDGKRVMDNTPVLTITACRNMWVGAYERLRMKIAALDAHHVGNIVLTDPHSNLTSLVTIVGWLIFGKKEKFLKIFPASGITAEDIRNSSKFASPVLNALNSDDWNWLNNDLLKIGSVKIDAALMLLELRGSKIFKKWAEFIKGAGEKGSFSRSLRVGIFTVYLPVGIIILSPIVTAFTKIYMFFNKRKINALKDYYMSMPVVEVKNSEPKLKR